MDFKHNWYGMIADETHFETQFFVAEKARAEGQFNLALSLYTALLDYRLKTATQSGFTNYDAIVIERLADLALLKGEDQAAQHLLEGLAGLYLKENNHYLFVYTLTKTGNILLGNGEKHALANLLDRLAPFIGDILALEIKEGNLKAWEQKKYFPGCSAEENNLLFSRLYYLMAGLLSALGQFNQALCCLERGIALAEKSTSVIAKQGLSALYIAQIRTILQKGDLIAAASLLNKYDLDPVRSTETISSGNQIARLELEAKMHLLKGDFGAAETLLSNANRICDDLDLHLATASTAVNLAYTKILLNQISEARSLLIEAERMANAHALKGQLPRIKQLKLLAYYRTSVPLTERNLSPRATFIKQTREEPVSDTIEVSEPKGDYLSGFEDKTLVFQMLLASNRWEKASIWLDNIKQVFQDTDSDLIQIRIAIMEQMMAYYQNALNALEYKEIQAFLKRQGLKPELWQYQRFLTWTHLVADGDKEQITVENEHLLNQLATSLPPEQQGVFLLNKWNNDEESLNAEIQHLLGLSSKHTRFFPIRWFYQVKRWRCMAHLMGRVDAYKDTTTCENLMPEGKERSALYQPIYSWWKRICLHPRSTVTISFLVLPDAILIIYQTFMMLRCRLTRISRVEVRNLARSLHHLAAQHRGGRSIGDLGDPLRISPENENIKALTTQIADLLHLP